MDHAADLRPRRFDARWIVITEVIHEGRLRMIRNQFTRVVQERHARVSNQERPRLYRQCDLKRGEAGQIFK